jgi:hypothetical protein
MPILRFPTTIENVPNNLYAYLTTKMGVGPALVISDVIALALQFILIEEGVDLQGSYGINEATWIAELFPEGQYVERKSVMITPVIRIKDGTSLTLFVDTDRDNKLIAYAVAGDNASTWFQEYENVTLSLEVVKIDQYLWRDDLGEASDTVWSVELMPSGAQVGNHILCQINEQAS